MPDHKPLVLSRGALWGSFVVLIVAVACVRLGMWQLDRLEQRRARNAGTEARMRAAPAQLSAVIDDTAGLLFRRVTLSGDYDHTQTVIIAGRSLRGVPGVHVLTPMRLGGSAVLVNRGWMPSADAARIEIDSIKEPSPRGAEALITPFPEDYGRMTPADSFVRVWYGMQAERLRRQFPYPVLPIIAQVLPHEGQPDFPVRLKAPAMEEGPHMGYAIQWFSFAAIALIGWAVLLLRRRSHREDHH
jgi:surfeit locus 1 family protein